MKPKTIDEIVHDHVRWFRGIENGVNREEVKRQLIELFMSCVPEERDNFAEGSYNGGFNACRDRMIKNLEKLK